jgi:DNA-binding NarL/FixJ family response regulator
MNRRVRVAVANTPRLLRELIVETINDQSDIEIVAEIQAESEIARAVELTAPEFLIIALDPPAPCPPFCSSLLQLHPKLKILALATERNYGVLYSAFVNVCASSLEASESGILQVLRSESRIGVRGQV